jgi:hypothetical protein
VLLNGTKSKLNVSTDLQLFGLVVTAEPYYSVTRPSDLIVMENVARADTVLTHLPGCVRFRAPVETSCQSPVERSSNSNFSLAGQKTRNSASHDAIRAHGSL